MVCCKVKPEKRRLDDIMIQKAVKPSDFKSFDPLEHASLSIDFLTQMTDSALGSLPYGFVSPLHNPPYAEHGRIDDAELIASWYEGLSCAREVLGTSKGADVEEALYGQLVDTGWDAESGLRFPVRRAWSGPTDYCVLSEMAIVLSALNRALEVDAKDKKAEKRAAGLVQGLRKLVIEHTHRAVGIGEFPLDEPCYSFQNDVYILGKGFDNAFGTSHADWVLRYSVLIEPLVTRSLVAKDAVALELAVGLANSITSLSHYFTNRNEFSGHVHSAMWTATGLAKLGRVASQDKYVAKAKGLYDFVRRSASAFGWVPEYMQWQLIADERCEACCIKDMMQCALELVDCGFPEYWDDVHRFWRNHLAESQIMETDFLPKSSDKNKDTEQRTYKNIADKIKGGVSGCTAPNSVSLARYRSISPCCSASAPQAMLSAWRRAAEFSRGNLTVNFPVDFENQTAKVTVGYPNTGYVRIKLKKPCRVIVRVFPWMPAPHEGTIDGRPAGLERRDDQVSFPAAEKGAVLEFKHELKMRRVMENVMGLDFFGLWRGPDMVDILPHGFGVRLYQRVQGAPFDVPTSFGEGLTRAETEPIVEPANPKETRLNRRKAPRS